MRFNRIAAVAASTALLAGGSLIATATAADANPGSPKCMTKAEWFKIHEGMSRTHVRQITGIPGHQTYSTYYSDGEHDISVEYHQCNGAGKPAKGSWNTVSIDYANGHYNNNFDWVRGYMRVDYKGSWSTPFSF
jgi:hypothetical protein